ncbi:MAG: hypothetical protein LC753_19155 [Acidobacteria bacterium]|nr:hypothetical protein [Acidobacteriota bacterium]
MRVCCRTARSKRYFVVAALLFAWAWPRSLAAQTNERIYEDLDFRFVTPGARPVGMGKTFIGLADDATAAASNPAGLSNLLEQEFSVEFVGTQIKHDRFIPSNTGEVQTFGDYVLTPSFLSYVLPAGRATFSLFRHSVQDYRESFVFGGRFIESLAGFEDGAYGTIAVKAENYGVAGAYVVNRMLSVGGSVSLSALDVATEARSGVPEVREGEQVRANPRNGTNTIDSDLRWSGGRAWTEPATNSRSIT